MSWIVISWINAGGAFQAEVLLNTETGQRYKWDGFHSQYVLFGTPTAIFKEDE